MARDVEEMAGAGSVAATDGAEVDYRVELIDNPSELPLERADTLNLEYADLACRACGGDPDDPNIREGWRAYCTGEGGRTQDFDRLVLVWDGDKLVGFSGWVVGKMDPDVTLLWYKAAGTDPEYQRRGAFAAARDTIADPAWMTSFGPPTYWVMRTPNPLIYDNAVRWWGRHPAWSERLFPKITPEGEMVPVDERTRETAIGIATALWPECEFDPDTFVVKDFLGQYGRDIWRVPAPHSPEPGTDRFFAKHLRPDNQDALMGFALFYE